MRGFYFVPAGQGRVFVVDASNNIVHGMPAKNRKTVNDALLVGLKSIKLDNRPITTSELQKYLTQK